MKHLKKFNENQKEKISFEDAKSWIRDKYSEDKVINLFDDEVAGGDWIDRDQMEEEGYENEYDYYTDYGRGEAEDAVVNMILSDLKSNFELDFDLFDDDTDIFAFLKEEYDVLD